MGVCVSVSCFHFPAAANFPAKGVVLKVGDGSLVLFVLLHNSLKLELDLRLRRLFGGGFDFFGDVDRRVRESLDFSCSSSYCFHSFNFTTPFS